MLPGAAPAVVGGRVRELHTCPVTGRTVILNDRWPDRPPAPGGPCWFCAAPGPVIAMLDGAFAVPHPTPALGIEGDPTPRRDDERVWREGVGAHELLFAGHDGDDVTLLRLARARIRDLRQDRRLRGFGLARRSGPALHTVWQLVALPFDLAPSSPAAWRDSEVADGVRMVGLRGDAVAIMAWAPRVPLETWVVPMHGRATFLDGRDDVAGLATELRGRLTRALGDVPIDMVVEDGEPWRIELLPRLGIEATVTAATGLPVHGASPEEAAGWLRGTSR